MTGPTRTFDLIDESKRVAAAKAQLEKDGHQLFVEFDRDHLRKIVHDEIGFLQSKIDSLRSTLPQLDVKESRASIVVSDLGFAEKKKLCARVDQAITMVNSCLKMPTYTQSISVKPVVIVLSAQDALDHFRFSDVRKDLDAYLADRQIEQSPIIIVDSAVEFGDESLERLFQKVAFAHASEAYSSKPLLPWVQVGLVRALRRNAFPSPGARDDDKAEIQRRLKIPGKFAETIATEDTANVDKVLALGVTDYLLRRDPQAYAEFLFDLKHGESMESALERNFRMNMRSFLLGFAQMHGVQSPPEA